MKANRKQQVRLSASKPFILQKTWVEGVCDDDGRVTH